MRGIVQDLLQHDETIWLEYKSFWYWNEGENPQKGWGEFLKDFAALFNTYSNTKDKKYFIIGFDEKTRITQNYYIDQNDKQLKIFNDIQLFKKKIVEKLKNHFKNTPEYKDSEALVSIETLFDLELVHMENNDEILVIIIKHAPYLLELKKVLQGNESFREGNIITRIQKDDGSPENTNATSSNISSLIEIVQNNKFIDFPEKDISIKKIVEVFKEKIFPSAEVKYIQSEANYSSGIYFEIYSLRGEYSTPLDFIYFSKHTVQNKTLEHIEKENLLDKSSKKIVLVDEYNKEKGRIDKKRIERLFTKSFYNIEVYYLEEFALQKLYSDLFDPSIFHQGNFGIKDFIKPYTDISEDKTADLLLREWYESPNDPLLVMKGMGGIGKTTVIKYFLDTLYNMAKIEKNMNILFINSHEIIDDIMKNPKIEDIFDFYRIIADNKKLIKKFDKKLLELSIDNGNIIIVLDGLDEVIAKIGNKFNINLFISSIYDNYSENLAKAKIVFTCRDYFWDKNQFTTIKTISLEPFSNKMTKEYFAHYFKDTPSKLDKAIALANEFSLKEKGKEVTFVPYILDMIREGLLIDSSVAEPVESKILLRVGNINDFLIGKACEREIKKLDNLSIDEQIKVFIYMAVEYDGILHDKHFGELSGFFKQKSSTSFIEKFKSHPLLEYNPTVGLLKFRYDFFNEYFKNIKLAIFFKENNFDDIEKEIIDISIQHISYDGSLMKDLKDRLREVDYEELKIAILMFITDRLPFLDIDEESKKRFNSSLFILLLVLSTAINTEERTNILKEIYSHENDEIQNLCIINLHTIGANKPLFNFSGMKFINCHFENYEYFTECPMDSDTFFTDCIFLEPLHREGINPDMTLKNIDASTGHPEGIIGVLQNKEKEMNRNHQGLRHDLKQVIKFFWSSSAFQQKTEEETLKKLRDYTRIIEKLIKEKVILKISVTTKQKRNDTAYKINPDYSNLRKIMEENNSCYEFDRIIKLFM